MSKPAISYIVSHFNRPMALRCCLASLTLQWRRDHEILVTDNSDDSVQAIACMRICSEFGVQRIATGKTCTDCYASADEGAKTAIGHWLCFPSDDSYYVPGFSKYMLEAAVANDYDLVYCDCVYDPRLKGKYAVMNTLPEVGSIDKTTFIVRRELFKGFPRINGTVVSDAEMVIELLRTGIRHGKASGVLCVHN